MFDQIIDPVTGFEIPKSWIELAKDPQIFEKIQSGLYVLLSNGNLLRRGLTTGTTAAAACKGAILSLHYPQDIADVMTPAGIRVKLPVNARKGFCIAIKDGGDHQFDVTHGLEIIAFAEDCDSIQLIAGKGIGRISKIDLSGPICRYAISQSARKQIMEAINESLVETKMQGAKIELSVPRGEIVAKDTLNPRLGIEGGISILGSTGFSEPWNDHLGESRMDEIRDSTRIVVTTGRTGLKYSKMLFPDHKAVLLGSQLDRVEFRMDQESIVCGLPALILKWAWPQILDGTGYKTISEMIEKEPNHPQISEALKRAKAKLPDTRIILLQKDGKFFRDL
ncbi:MAG: cobalt-precorrin-5B (C(1))-methyltransferase [Methanotrichaceae archaeon]|nr:cobalt-precorrin-5B (C(1))-methyltransferase [Methanotrichaceae archaeon]